LYLTSLAGDYSLQFSTLQGMAAYVIIREFTNLTALTVCFWMKTDDKKNSGTPFSYSTFEESNELLLLNYQKFELFIHGEKR